MKHQLAQSISTRIVEDLPGHMATRFLPNASPDDYIDSLISTVYLYTRPKKGKMKSILFSEVISAIGHSIRSKFKLKRDSALAAKAGAFLLYAFEEAGLIRLVLGQGARGHNTYFVTVLNDEAICALWMSVSIVKLEKLPSETPFEPWTSSRHGTGVSLVKTREKTVLEKLTPDSHPIIFACVNKAQRVGWQVNQKVFELHSWALRNKTEAFADIWEAQNFEARTTKLREVRTISDMAKRLVGKTFYHLYTLDFRGRKYPQTAYLHEQSSDSARGLLLRADKKAIGEPGFFWLMVSIASNWAGDAGREDGAKTDKIPLRARYEWALDNEEILLSYAESPKVNQGWMLADKPWQFIASCIELKNIRIWQYSVALDFDSYDFESHIEGYIDGSTNGAQHLTALARDEETAPYVNLVPLDLPGDLYKYVADHVWERVSRAVSEMPTELVLRCESFISELIDIKKQIQAADPKGEQRKELVSRIQAFKTANAGISEAASPVFWNRIIDSKQKRKICKRNVMSLPYGSTAYGLSEQQINDARKHGIESLFYLEHRWGSYLGRAVFEDCRTSLKKPMQLLQVFEAAGSRAEAEGRFLSWTVPVTGFPVVQNYTEGKVKKVYVQYGPPIGERRNTGYYINTLQLSICFIEDVKPSKGKQAQGASPNAIHSLDAAHLMMTVDRCDFPVTTIHDSFGCLLADMPELFKVVRQTFVELYQANPLESLMFDIGGSLEDIEIGNLDISLVLDSEYCFS